MKLFSLGRDERIKSRAIFDNLFVTGTALYGQSFKLIYIVSEFNSKFPVQAAFVVPRKNIRHAVMRNLIRRRMKEAYRKNKSIVYEKASSTGKGIRLALIYTGNTPLNYTDTEEKIIVILRRLIQEEVFKG